MTQAHDFCTLHPTLTAFTILGWWVLFFVSLFGDSEKLRPRFALGLLFLLPCGASAAVSGRLDLMSPLAYGAWQSLTSADQAVGFTKRAFVVSKDGQEVAHLAIFLGATKAFVSDAGAPARPLGGAVVAVPGSLLDWALGTSWGQRWLPSLKTGLLAGYDLTRLKQLHAAPGFIGVGISKAMGGNP